MTILAWISVLVGVGVLGVVVVYYIYQDSTQMVKDWDWDEDLPAE